MDAYNQHMNGLEKANKKATKKTNVREGQQKYWNYWNEDNVEQDPKAAPPQDFTQTAGFYEGLMLPKEFAEREENEEERQITDRRQLIYGHTVEQELLKEFGIVQDRTHNFTWMEVMEGKWANRNLRRRINLEHCKLKGEMPAFEGPAYHAAAKLRVLTLMDNDISGKVPSMAMFLHLHTLNLSFNGLHGPIPDLQACVKLKYCYLNNNKFDGTPPSFQACEELSELWLHCNCLSGVNEWRDDATNFHDAVGLALVCSKQYPHLAVGAPAGGKKKGGRSKAQAQKHGRKASLHESGKALFRSSLASPGQ